MGKFLRVKKQSGELRVNESYNDMRVNRVRSSLNNLGWLSKSIAASSLLLILGIGYIYNVSQKNPIGGLSQSKAGTTYTTPVIDSSCSRVATSGAQVKSTTAFTPPSNSRILAFVASDSLHHHPNQHTITSTGGLSWQLITRSGWNTLSGQTAEAEVWTAYVTTSPGPVVVTDTGVDIDKDTGILTTECFTGADPELPQAVNASNVSSAQISVTLTTSRDNSYVYAVASDWDNVVAGAHASFASGQQTVAETNTPQVWGGVWRTSSTVPTAGTAVTMATPTTPSLSPAGNWNAIAVEIRGSGARPIVGAGINGVLKTNPVNPRYFTDNTGKSIYLTGAHTWYDLLDGGSFYAQNKVMDYTKYLETMVANNQNFLRMWVPDTSATTAGGVAVLAPYGRATDSTLIGNAADGMPKYNLDTFNQAYFDSLRARAQQAQDRGIYLDLMMFDVIGYDNPAAWQYHWFNAGNNSNGVNGDTNANGDGVEALSLADPTIVAYQKAYIAKVIDTVNSLDNVVYEICNECGAGSTAWQHSLIDYIHTYEAGKPKQHVVGMTTENIGTNSTLFSSNAEWVSPTDAGTVGNLYSTNPPVGIGDKVVLADDDHFYGVNNMSNHDWVWKTMTRGLNPLFMDKATDFTGRASGHELVDANVRYNLGATYTYANRMDLNLATPQGNLTSTSYALVNPGHEYLVYQPTTGSFTVTMQAGTYQVEWFDPVTLMATTVANQTVSSGAVSFSAPGGITSDSVLYLRNVAQPTPSPTPTPTLTPSVTPSPTPTPTPTPSATPTPTVTPTPNPTITPTVRVSVPTTYSRINGKPYDLFTRTASLTVSVTGSIPGLTATVNGTTTPILNNKLALPSVNGDYKVILKTNTTTYFSQTIRLRHPDYNRDGTVSISDLNLLNARIDLTYRAAYTVYDLNLDSKLDASDVARLQTYWGR